MHQRKTPSISVYFDGDCPICRKEVVFYRRLDRQQRISWVDITALSDDDLPADVTREELLGIFHVRQPGHGWVKGVDAFAAIWRALPFFRHLAWVFATPVLRQCAQWGYRLFLRWQNRARMKRAQTASADSTIDLAPRA